MSVLFGHPTGNPNSHQAALAHFEAGRLEAFCVPWMPSAATLRSLEHIVPLRSIAQRLARRHFEPLADAPKIQGRTRELCRLATRILCGGDERVSYDANDWLMHTMRKHCVRSAVTVVHSYEDCSLSQFEKASHLGKACIYDMPIGYYPAWEQTQNQLAKQFSDWLPADGLSSTRYVRPEQKRREMELANLVLVPSAFVADTVRNYFPEKTIALAPYGVDVAAWFPRIVQRPTDTLTFLFAGQCSLRKGIPLLLKAWRAAGLKGARLQLVGSWQLAEEKKNGFPHNATWIGPVSRDQLRECYQQANVFVLPTFFEGRALVIGEAMASGLPVLSTPASGAEDLIDDSCGKLVPAGNLEALVEGLKWFDQHREQLSELSRAARVRAERCTWRHYRHCVTSAVAPFV